MQTIHFRLSIAAIILFMVALGVADVWFVSKQIAPPESQAPIVSEPPANLVDIRTLNASQIKSILIVDKWDGLSSAAPFSGEYILGRAGDGWSGRISITLGGRNSARQNVTDTLNVPMNIIEQFVHKLGTASVGPVVTKPRPTVTDSCGQLSVDITLDRNSVKLYRPRGGTDDLWYISSNGSGLGMIEDGVPTAALDDLRPYIKQDFVDKLVADVRHR